MSPCVQNVLRKVQHQDALQISDVVMASLLRMFQSTAGSGGVQEDALMAVSTLVEGESAGGGPLLKSAAEISPVQEPHTHAPQHTHAHSEILSQPVT